MGPVFLCDGFQLFVAVTCQLSHDTARHVSMTILVLSCKIGSYVIISELHLTSPHHTLLYTNRKHKAEPLNSRVQLFARSWFAHAILPLHIATALRLIMTMTQTDMTRQLDFEMATEKMT